MSANLKPEYFQIYLGEDRVLPLRVDNIDGSPFSLVGATEIEARFKKSDTSALSKKLNSVAQVTKLNILNAGNSFDVVGPAKALVLSTTTSTDYFWFKVTDGTNTQVDPGLSGTGHQVDILKADLQSAIATKLSAAILLVSGYSTAVSSNIVTVTNLVAGQVQTPPSLVGSPSTITVSVSTLGTTSGITIINGLLGKLSVSLTSADTALLLLGERQNFSLIITSPSGVRKVNYQNALSVDRQVV